MKRQTFLIFLLIIIVLCIISIKSVNALDSKTHDQAELISNTDTNSKVSYNLGQWAYSIFITYAILLVLGILYYKKKLPLFLEKPIQFIFKFEVSQKVSLLILSGLIAIFIIFKIGNLQNPEEASFSDYQRTTQLIQSWNIFSSIHDDITEFRLNLHYLSLHIFGNIRVIAFLETISLLILTYLTTYVITKKRFAGIVSVVVLLQSSLFLRYSVSVTYDNLWTLFYLISLYMIYKKWYLSPISYVLSLLSKPLIAIYLPMTFFFIHRANIKTSKRKLIFSYLGILAIIAAVIILEGSDYNIHSLYFDEFRTGLMAFEIFMSSEGLVMIFLLPLVVGLFLLSRRGILQADSIMILLAGILWSSPFLVGFTDLSNQPYRFVPFVVFFAIGIGTLLSTRDVSPPQNKKYVTNAVFAFTFVTVIINLFFVIFPTIMKGSYRLTIG